MSTLIPRAVFFGDPDRASVQLSPDGKQLAWLAPADGVLNVWVAPVDDLDKARPVTADRTRPVQVYAWAYTNQHILYMQDQGGDENFHVFAVDLKDLSARDLTPVAGARAVIYGVSRHHPEKLLVGLNDRDPQLMDLHLVDLAGGERQPVLINEQGFAGFQIDEQLNVRFAEVPTPDGGLQVHARDGGNWTPVDQVPGDDLLTTSFVGFDATGTRQYVIDSRGRDTGALFELDVATRKSRLLAEDTRADVGGVIVHPTELRVQAATFTYDRRRWIVLDPAIQPDLDALARVDDGELEILSRTLDDHTWLVAFRGDASSTRYYLWDRHEARFLFTGRKALEGLSLARMHPQIIPARDGLPLVSYLSLPPSEDRDGRPRAPLPTVLLVHGGPWARDEWGFDPLHQLLTNRGYAVLAVNFRGSTGFGKQFVNAGNLEWGKKMHDDLLDAVEWLVREGIAPRDKIAIMGGSYGGYATLAGLALTPDVFAAGVDIVGPSSIVTLLESIPPYWAPMIALFKTRVGDFTTPEGKAVLDAVSPLTHSAKIKKPLLIGQGANDPRVKVHESEQIVAAMQKAGIPVSYVLFTDEGHGFARKVNNLAFFGAVEAFLAAHLGGKFQPLSADELSASTLQLRAGELAGVPRS